LKVNQNLRLRRSDLGWLLLIPTLLGALLSPILLSAIVTLATRDQWETLSFVGQTYGAIAALITTLSLAAIAASLLIQNRALSVQIEQGSRDQYIELISIGLNHPEARSGGPFNEAASPAMMYSGLWITQWRALYVMEYMPEVELRTEFELLFTNSPEARARWALSREAYKAGAAGKRGNDFFRIVDEIHGTILQQGSEVDTDDGDGHDATED
jgi:hypothetical protein